MNDSKETKADGNATQGNGAADGHREHDTAESATGIDRARTERPRIPGPLLLAALAIIAAGTVWLITQDDSAPALEPRTVGNERDGYRLVTGRVTPPAAEELSDSFVRATGLLREQVLQRLSELQAEWKVAGPRVSLHPFDVQGDAVAFAEQLEGWLERNNLLAGETVAMKSDTESTQGAGSDSSTAMNETGRSTSAQNVVEGDLPAPPAPGLVIRSRSDDIAIARDLALALAPVIGGEVNVLTDERVDTHHLVVALVGAPRFGEDGVAYFQAR